jgi:hypothetical protein
MQGPFIVRWLRRGAALVMAILIAACLCHQALQFAAGFLPDTRGTSTGVRDELAEHLVASVRGRGFSVPATRLCVLADGYRYAVDGIAHEAMRIHLEVPIDWTRGCDVPPLPLVDVHYVPWAPQWAVPAPALSPMLWLFLSTIALPMLIVLAMPGKVARWCLAFLGKLPRPGRD